MKKAVRLVLNVLLFLTCLPSCNQRSSKADSISTDPTAIAAGQQLFTLNCSACHNFTKDGIGPQLQGLTTSVSADWIEKFIRDPQQMISSGDQRAQQLYQKYKTGMPAFGGLKDEEIKKIVVFINSQKPGAP